VILVYNALFRLTISGSPMKSQSFPKPSGKYAQFLGEWGRISNHFYKSGSPLNMCQILVRIGQVTVEIRRWKNRH